MWSFCCNTGEVCPLYSGLKGLLQLRTRILTSDFLCKRWILTSRNRHIRYYRIMSIYQVTAMKRLGLLKRLETVHPIRYKHNPLIWFEQQILFVEPQKHDRFPELWAPCHDSEIGVWWNLVKLGVAMKGSKVIAMGRVNWEHPINKSIQKYTSMDFLPNQRMQDRCWGQRA